MDFIELQNSVKTPHQQMAIDNCICFYRVGSHLYGTNTPNSDEDYEGIFIEPPNYVLGTEKCDEVTFSSGNGKTRNTKDDKDIKFYSLRKFFNLAGNNNPNKVETFFIPPEHILYSTPYFKQIVDNYKLFISQKVKHSFSGYAYAQKKKLLGKKRRLDELREFEKILLKGVEEGKKTIGDLDLIDVTSFIHYDITTGKEINLGVKTIKGKYDYIRYHQTEDNLDTIMVDDKVYNLGMDINLIHEHVKNHIDSYGGRTAQLDEHSFDVKFAAHVFRLIDEGIELLCSGNITFPCRNRELQLAIKNGKYSLDQVLNMMDDQEPFLDEAYTNSIIQYSPKHKEISLLQQKIMLEWWKNRGLI